MPTEREMGERRQDPVKKLRALKPEPREQAKRSLGAEIAVEIIRAYRRGVSMERIAKAAGRGRGTLYAIVGTWALKHAHLPEDNER